LIENRVNGIHSKLPQRKVIIYSAGVAFAFLLLMVTAFLPDAKTRMESKVNHALIHANLESVEIPADKLANEIVNNYYRINIIDVRTPEAFTAYHLPFAINIPIDKMNERQWKNILNQKHKANYFYADDLQAAKKGYLLAEYLGKAENYLLTESPTNFKKMFYELEAPGSDAGKKELNIYNFRKKVATDMKMLVNALKNSTEPVVVKTTKIKGGC
jgi:hypothetical protein